jgi:hypothetical protein
MVGSAEKGLGHVVLLILGRTEYDMRG